ncbi:MAG: MerR family transcriptional regulator [Tabrizicola sp.]
MTERGLRRSELAGVSGCNSETIRYYEAIGLMPRPARTEAGRRVYGRQDVKRLRFIIRARELGFPLEDIRSLLGLGDAGARSCAAVRELTDLHLAKMRERITDLQRIEAELSRTAALCRNGETAECAVLDSLAGESG